MQEINVHIDDLGNLFQEFVGGADYFDEEEYETLKLYDLSTRTGRLDFIRKFLWPVYLKLDAVERDNLKYSLWYYKTYNPDKVKYFADRSLFPFDFPENVSEFLEEIWFEFYKETSVSLDNFKVNVVE